MSELTGLLEAFLILQEAKQEPIEQQLLLLKRFRHHKNEKRFKQLSQKINWSLNRSNNELIDHFDHLFKLNQERLQFHGAQNIRDYKLGLIEANRNLDIRFLIKKLEYYAELLNKRIVLNTSDEQQAIELILTYIEAEDYLTIKLVRVYYFLVKMLLQPNDEKFFEAYHDSLRNLQQADKQVLWDLYTHALNYAASKSNQGNKHYLSKYNELIKDMIGQDVLLQNEKLNPWLFKNIITQALKNNEIQWAEHFLNSYKEHLPKEDLENHINYNQAHVFYYRQRLDMAQMLLQRVEFTDVFLNIGTKVILLKVYYESNQIELLDAHLKAFKMYIFRNKSITDDKKVVINKLIDHTNKLKNLIASDASRLNQLKVKVAKEPVLDKEWLLMKIEEKLA